MDNGQVMRVFFCSKISRIMYRQIWADGPNKVGYLGKFLVELPAHLRLLFQYFISLFFWIAKLNSISSLYSCQRPWSIWFSIPCMLNKTYFKVMLLMYFAKSGTKCNAVSHIVVFLFYRADMSIYMTNNDWPNIYKCLLTLEARNDAFVPYLLNHL